MPGLHAPAQTDRMQKLSVQAPAPQELPGPHAGHSAVTAIGEKRIPAQKRSHLRAAGEHAEIYSTSRAVAESEDGKKHERQENTTLLAN